MSRHAKRSRADNRTRHQRAQAKQARRRYRKGKLLSGPAGPELVTLPAGTRVIPNRSLRG